MLKPNKYSFIKPEKFPFFYGYVVLFIGTIGVLASVPGQTIGVSVFTDPVKNALGLSRNQFSNAYMLGTLLSSMVVSRAGVWFDAYGARYVAFFAAILLSIALLLASFSVEISAAFKYFFNSSSWLISFITISFLFFLIRFSGQGILTMASRNMIMIWFKKNRGKINSISSIVVSLGFSSSPILLNKLITDNGWQISWQIMALCLLLFSFCILQFYRNKPEDFKLLPDGFSTQKNSTIIENEEKDFTLQEAKNTRAFWMFGLMLSFHSFFSTGFTFHVVSIFNTQSYSKSEAIAIFLPISIIAVLISALCNILSDYVHHKIYLYVMLGSGIIASFGMLLLAKPVGIYMIIVGIGVMGGLFTVINAVTWPKYYGRKYLGTITGKIMSFLVVSSAIAPSLFSYCYSIMGSYSYISYITLLFLFVVTIGSIRVKNPQ